MVQQNVAILGQCASTLMSATSTTDSAILKGTDQEVQNALESSHSCFSDDTRNYHALTWGLRWVVQVMQLHLLERYREAYVAAQVRYFFFCFFFPWNLH